MRTKIIATIITVMVSLVAFSQQVPTNKTANVLFKTKLYSYESQKEVSTISKGSEVQVIGENVKFKTPINYEGTNYFVRSDAIRVNPMKSIINAEETQYRSLEYTNYCLNQFRKSQLTAIGLSLGGGLLSFAGGSNDNDELIMIGGVVMLSGFIVHFSSYRWLEKAYVAPIKGGAEIGMAIKF